MIKSFPIVIILLSFALRMNALHIDVYKIELSSSSLEWQAKKVTGQHHGEIKFLSGELRDNHGTFSGTFEVDMNSITVNDLDGGSKTKLENHLKSDDFFNAVTYPQSTLTITSIKSKIENNDKGNLFIVEGILKIRDKSAPVTFDAAMELGKNKMMFAGEMTIDRSKFDVKYRSKAFYSDLGDKLIYDDFKLIFNLTMNKFGH